MKVAFISENGLVGKVPRTFENARVEFAWMISLDATHYNISDITQVSGYDYVFVILPKIKTNLSAEGSEIGSKIEDPRSRFHKADFIDRLKNQKTSDSIQTIMSQGESAAKQIYNFDIFADKTAGPESGAALGKKENFIGEDPITSQDDYYTKQRKKKTEEFNKQIFDFDKKRLQMKPLKMSYGMKNNK